MTTIDETEVVAGIGNDYKYGFHDKEDYFFKSGRGLTREVVANISEQKNEPQWMRDQRLKALEYFEARPLPTWGGRLEDIDFDAMYYYIRPTEKQATSWEDLPPDIKNTWDRLGIPEAERKFLAGVGAQYESEVVYHKLQEHLESQGVLFLDMDSALRDHEDIVKEYFGSVIPANDNKFAALNSAVWSGGSFIYVPPGVRIEQPLQAYFRINAENMGQFERTLIIVDEDAYVHYVEGCTAPIYSSDSLHSAVVEIIVRPRGRCRYTTIQNWSTNVYNLVTKRAVAYENATMEWVDGNLGSKLTMKYPAIWLMGEGAHGEVLSIAFANEGQHQDAGGKCVHVAPNTTSVITSKSISKNGGRSSYRGLLEVAKGAHGAKSKVVCDALILDADSRTDTYPYIRIDEDNVDIGHEATVSKIGEEQLFYLMSRGLIGVRGDGDDRVGLRRADHEGAPARVRGRDEQADSAADGRLRRLGADGVRCDRGHRLHLLADARHRPRDAVLRRDARAAALGSGHRLRRLRRRRGDCPARRPGGDRRRVLAESERLRLARGGCHRGAAAARGERRRVLRRRRRHGRAPDGVLRRPGRQWGRPAPEERVKVERVDFVDVPTRDLERATAFYRDVLELPQDPREPTEFEAGNVTLALWEPEKMGVEFPRSAAHGIALRVADVGAARAELEERGVEFVGERDSGVCNMAFFTDPDGNSLILHRRYAP